MFLFAFFAVRWLFVACQTTTGLWLANYAKVFCGDFTFLVDNLHGSLLLVCRLTQIRAELLLAKGRGSFTHTSQTQRESAAPLLRPHLTSSKLLSHISLGRRRAKMDNWGWSAGRWRTCGFLGIFCGNYMWRDFGELGNGNGQFKLILVQKIAVIFWDLLKQITRIRSFSAILAKNPWFLWIMDRE